MKVHIAAETRTEFGKGAARRSRREGRVPAVLYGHGTETRHLSLPGHDLMLALKTPNVLLYLDGLNKGSEIALPKAVQRNPVRGSIEHVDLILVRRGEKVTVEIPVRVTGQISAVGDGMLNQQLVQIPLEADATSIPQADRRRRDGPGGRPVGARRRPEAAAGRHPAGRPGNAGPGRHRADGRSAEEAEAPEVPEAVADQVTGQPNPEQSG